MIVLGNAREVIMLDVWVLCLDWIGDYLVPDVDLFVCRMDGGEEITPGVLVIDGETQEGFIC